MTKHAPLWPILAVSSLGIILDKSTTTLSSFGLLGLGFCSLGFCFFRRLSPKTNLRSSSPLTLLRIALLLFIGAVFGFYSGSQRLASKRKLEAWTHILKNTDQGLNALQWSPVAVKGVVAERVRFRQSLLTSTDAPRDPQPPWSPPRNKDQSEKNSIFERLSSLTPQSNTSQLQTLTLLHITHIRDGTDWVPTEATAPLTIDARMDGLLPGDRIQIFGQWKLPAFSGNPGQFDRATRYAELNYAAQIRVNSSEQIAVTGPPQSLRFDRHFARIGGLALKTMETHVPLGQSDLAAALLLGQRDMVQWRLQEDLLATGSIHMLSISGMHIEMIALSLIVIGTILMVPRYPLLVLVCALVWIYTMICGTNPPVLRAAIMLTTATLGRAIGWKSYSMNNLALAGLILLAGRPSVLFETGTQLSFLAVAVLIVAGSQLVKRPAPLTTLIHARQSKAAKTWRHVTHFCYEMLKSSFWVWFMTAPLVWVTFHVISPIAILLNLVLWLPMLIALLSGLGLILIGWIPLFGAPLGLICGSMLYLVDKSVVVANQIPFGHFWLSAPPNWWMVLFYLITIGVVVVFGTRYAAARRRIVGLLLLWFTLGLAYLPIAARVSNWVTPPSLQITFLDVGHGCHTWIHFPDGKLWCYDAGRMGDHERSYRVMVDALWAEQTQEIDTLLLSHGDSDHYNGIPGIAERFFIRRFASTANVFNHQDPWVQSAVDFVSQRAKRLETFKHGMTEHIAGCKISILHPNPKSPLPTNASDNANSLCLLLEFAGRRILLPGDIEPPGTDQLTKLSPVPLDILLAPHHGSLHSAGERIAEWGNAKHVVVSGGLRSLSPKVHELYSNSVSQDNLQGPRKLWFTAKDRAIRFSIEQSGKIAITTWRTDGWVADD